MKILTIILGGLLIFIRFAVGLYVLWFLIGNIHSPEKYNLDELRWFIYFFVWDLWVGLNNQKINSDIESENENIQ